MLFTALRRLIQLALKPMTSGEVLDPQCVSYCVSTHGVRHFMTDLLRPDRAIFIEEGQELPMYDLLSCVCMVFIENRKKNFNLSTNSPMFICNGADLVRKIF